MFYSGNGEISYLKKKIFKKIIKKKNILLNLTTYSIKIYCSDCSKCSLSNHCTQNIQTNKKKLWAPSLNKVKGSLNSCGLFVALFISSTLRLWMLITMNVNRNCIVWNCMSYPIYLYILILYSKYPIFTTTTKFLSFFVYCENHN